MGSMEIILTRGLPIVLEYSSVLLKPLFEKIDVIHYTQMSRILKVAEEYALRLLWRTVGGTKAREIYRTTYRTR